MKIFLKPAEGKKTDPKTGKPQVLKVINPETGEALPPEGAEVESSSYWTRRLLDKSVFKAEKPKAAKAGDK